MKIFVTGDNHFGLKYESHAKKEIIIEERLNALSRMAAAANAEKCGLFIVTGDLFENNDFDKSLARDVSERLCEFNGTVAVLPGNHDFYTPQTLAWQNFPLGDRIILMNEYRPYSIKVGEETAVLYPAFCDRKHSGENRLGRIKELSADGTYHIGVAHGAVKGKTPDKDDKYFMMTAEELNNIPMDVWLIGHTHVPFPRDLTENFEIRNERIFNAGAHVQRDVDNDTDGECFIIEIDENKTIRAKKFCPSRLRFYRVKEPINIVPNRFEETVSRELGRFNDMSEVEITVKGVATDEELEKSREILERTGARFLSFKYHISEMVPFIDERQIMDTFPETDLSAKLLLELLNDNDPVAVKEAYDMLTELKGEK